MHETLRSSLLLPCFTHFSLLENVIVLHIVEKTETSKSLMNKYIRLKIKNKKVAFNQVYFALTCFEVPKVQNICFCLRPVILLNTDTLARVDQLHVFTS